MTYHAPTDMTDALDRLAQGDIRIVAGATDWLPTQGDRPVRDDILDITRLPGLRGITRQDDDWFIGATTTWSDILQADLPSAFDGLKAAAREVGSVQIQNTATVAGNLCNASPAADGVPPLLTLGAEVTIASRGGMRSVPLDRFITGVRRTALQADELVTGLRIPDPGASSRGAFVKLGSRRYLVISIAMAAVVLKMEDGAITTARVAVGACSAVAQRLPGLEKALCGATPGDVAARLRAEHFASLEPITDIRGTAEYRRATASELCLRAICMAMKEKSHG